MSELETAFVSERRIVEIIDERTEKWLAVLADAVTYQGLEVPPHQRAAGSDAPGLSGDAERSDS